MISNGQARVIIVEDDASMNQALERIVRAGGYRPVTFVNAEELQNLGIDESVACLILDQQLPGISGLQLLDWVRGQTNVPAVVITARDEHMVRDRARELGVSQFLVKPFTGRQLLDAIELTVVNSAQDVSGRRSHDDE